MAVAIGAAGGQLMARLARVGMGAYASWWWGHLFKTFLKNISAADKRG
jgi:hypothetical protein